MVYHKILLDRLENWMGLSGAVLNCLKSYLNERYYLVFKVSYMSEWMKMVCGVPQGSILGPLLFKMYMLPLGQIMENNKINDHSYADDTRIYITITPGDCSPIQTLSRSRTNIWNKLPESCRSAPTLTSFKC